MQRIKDKIQQWINAANLNAIRCTMKANCTVQEMVEVVKQERELQQNK